MRESVGRYKGIDYRLQRICDAMVSRDTARWYFTYLDGIPTGDSFATLADLQQAVDRGWDND